MASHKHPLPRQKNPYQNESIEIQLDFVHMVHKRYWPTAKRQGPNWVDTTNHVVVDDSAAAAAAAAAAVVVVVVVVVVVLLVLDVVIVLVGLP